MIEVYAYQHSHAHLYSRVYSPGWILAHMWEWWQREHKDQVLEWETEGYDASLRGWTVISEVIEPPIIQSLEITWKEIANA